MKKFTISLFSPMNCHFFIVLGFIVSAFALGAEKANAAGNYSGDTTISTVAVNGGQDGPNPGTTCIQLKVPVASACSERFIAIQNNNRQLLATALLSKTTASTVNVIYEDSAGANHCPGLVWTPCAVISIQSK